VKLNVNFFLLGNSPNTAPLLEAIEASTGIKTAFLFNPVNTPASSQKIPVSRYIIPSGLTLAQFANLANQAPNTPFLLLINANSPSALEIKSLYNTFQIGSIEVTEDSVTVIPQVPVQSASIPVQTGYYQPESSVSPQSPIPTVPVESSFQPASVSSAASGSQVTSSASQSAPQNSLNLAASSAAIPSGLNINNNQDPPLSSSASSLSDV
jgi:hypothetical protein